MRQGSLFTLFAALLLASAVPASASPHIRRGPTAPHASRSRALRVSTRAAAVSRPAGIAPERATQIQAALIKAGYLTGTPSGSWDAQSQAAMEKLQGDNGWQTKLVPDSRAIIKLGLGANSPVAVQSTASAVETPAGSAAAEPVAHASNQ